ncbi:MAG TPA: hypothetical protein VN857_00575 [Chthoniobacterales bacterium]|nr:hypothetical protein [Chthoniobacterales bacterium]
MIFLKGAAILFVPALLFYGSLTFPLPLVLVLVFLTGLWYDLQTIPLGSGRPDYVIGTSIVIYLIPAMIIHGFRPLFIKKGWGVHLVLAELAAILTPFCLLAQYAIISFERSDFFFSDVIVWRILGPGLIAMVTTPFVFLFLSSLSHLVGFRPRAEVAKLS